MAISRRASHSSQTSYTSERYVIIQVNTWQIKDEDFREITGITLIGKFQENFWNNQIIKIYIATVNEGTMQRLMRTCWCYVVLFSSLPDNIKAYSSEKEKDNYCVMDNTHLLKVRCYVRVECEFWNENDFLSLMQEKFILIYGFLQKEWTLTHHIVVDVMIPYPEPGLKRNDIIEAEIVKINKMMKGITIMSTIKPC